MYARGRRSNSTSDTSHDMGEDVQWSGQSALAMVLPSLPTVRQYSRQQAQCLYPGVLCRVLSNIRTGLVTCLCGLPMGTTTHRDSPLTTEQPVNGKGYHPGKVAVLLQPRGSRPLPYKIPGTQSATHTDWYALNHSCHGGIAASTRGTMDIVGQQVGGHNHGLHTARGKCHGNLQG